MKIKSFLLAGLIFISGTAFAATELPAIYPAVHNIVADGGTLSLKKGYTIVGADSADPVAVELLRKVLNGSETEGGIKIFIGEAGDAAVASAIEPENIDGAYTIKVTSSEIIICGNNDRGTFYGVQTLRQLVEGSSVPTVTISDYPDVKYRGVVEGFYGTPWSHADRLGQLDFYGDNKMNTYIYGPKDDPYHSSPNWRKPYPENEAVQLRSLVERAKKNKVDFVWAIHPGQDIQWNNADSMALINKFNMMYDLGVRAFAVFFDDISGIGTNPNRQAELLNFLTDKFVKVKGDVLPLVMCPTEYNKSWANPGDNGYLRVLGRELNPEVEIMWTGDMVVADIDMKTLNWINPRIQRPAYIWWNFPVSDYIRNQLLMGASYGLDKKAKGQMSGFVSNPMEHAEASKLAIFGVADYSWNIEGYNYQEAWEEAIHRVMPSAEKAFRTFATHNSDLVPNGHKYRREESEALAPYIMSYISDLRKGGRNKVAAKSLRSEFKAITAAEAAIRANKDNQAIVEEMSPWLKKFTLTGKLGTTVLDMGKGSQEARLQRLYDIIELGNECVALDTTLNKNPYQPGIKSGVKYIMPFIYSAVNQEAGMLAGEIFRTKSDSVAKGFVMNVDARYKNRPENISSIGQLRNSQIRQDKSVFYMAPVLEVMTAKKDRFAGVNFKMPRNIVSVSADLGVNAPWIVLETSTDGEQWEAMEYAIEGNKLISTQKREAAFIRLRNGSDSEQQFYMKGLEIATEPTSAELDKAFAVSDKDITTGYVVSQLFDREITPNASEIVIVAKSTDGYTVDMLDAAGNVLASKKTSSLVSKLTVPANAKTISIKGNVTVYEMSFVK